MAAFKLVEAPEPQADTIGSGTVRTELARIVEALTTHFDAAGLALSDAVGTIDQVVTALREVASVFDSGEAASAVQDLMQAAEDLRTVKAQADLRACDIAEIRESSVTLRVCIGEIQRCIQVLDIYGMNVKITASGVAEFMEFADRMRGKLNAASSEVRSFGDTLELLESSLCAMRRNDTLLVDECAKVVPQVPDRLMRDAEALKQHQAGLVRLAQSTNAVAQAIRSELGLALGAIQIGDRVRQRLEHVMFGCQLVDDTQGHGDALRKCMNPLLGALANAAAAEFGKDAASFLASLRRLKDRSDQLTALHEPGHDSDGRGFLGLLESGIAEAEAMIAQFGQADRQGVATLEQILSTVDDIAAKMAAITELRLDVQNMAINIGLSCRNVGQLGKPIMVVANEIRTYSDRLDQSIQSISKAEANLLATSSRMNAKLSQGGASVDQLSQFLAVIRACDDRTMAALEVVDSNAGGVRGCLDRAIAQLDELLSRTGKIGEIASSMEQAEIDDPCLAEDAAADLQQVFDALARNYTMSDEREIHNRWIPRGITGIVVAQAAPSAMPDDDDDDGLF